jgi:hypothetical protein
VLLLYRLMVDDWEQRQTVVNDECVQACVVHTYSYILLCIHTPIYTYSCIYTPIYTYSYIYTPIYTYSYIYTPIYTTIYILLYVYSYIMQQPTYPLSHTVHALLSACEYRPCEHGEQSTAPLALLPPMPLP